MAIRNVVQVGDDVLRKKCFEVTAFDDKLAALLDDMKETVRKEEGAGLAAPQVGRNIRMLVMDDGAQEEERRPRVLINPRLTLEGEKVISKQEGCLSVPFNYRADVTRYERVRLQAQDLDGNEIDEELTDFAAIIVQHECDHLDGVLFIDHISRLRRSMYDSKVKKCLKRKAAE